MQLQEELLRRSAGILMDPRSLPGKFGIGDLGPKAYEFVRFLADCGLTWWQMLPLGRPADGRCPYTCDASCSRNPFLISPEVLVAEGLLRPKDLSDIAFPERRIDFPRMLVYKQGILERAFQRWDSGDSNGDLRGDFEQFKHSAAGWLNEYALFCALKEDHNGSCWNDWPRGLATGKKRALETAAGRLHNRLEAHKFWQWIFARQWAALRSHCLQHGINIIGDMPMYVAYDSADVWGHKELFKLDDQLRPTVVAGVPPDYFSSTGQMWGNPIPRWEGMLLDGFKWWIQRMSNQLELVDVIRFDHFRALDAAWEVPADHQTAEHGTWQKTLGAELLTALNATFGKLPIIAEDLGYITPEVVALRDRFGLPGMLVEEKGLAGDNERGDNPHLLHKFYQHCVAYTGTHDTDTILGWYSTASDSQRRQARRYLGSDGRQIHWDAIKALLRSPSAITIVPMQDFLGLPSWARMNTPGTVNDANWSWRCRCGELNARLAKKISGLNVLFGRAPPVHSLD